MFLYKIDSFYPFSLHLLVWFVIANFIHIDLNLIRCIRSQLINLKREHCVLPIFVCVFDCYWVKALFILGTILIKKKTHTLFSQKKKGTGMLPGWIQHTAIPTTKTMEAIRILQCMGMKSSRSNLVCLQYCLMEHKEEKPRVWCSVLHFLSRTAYPHHGLP